MNEILLPKQTNKEKKQQTGKKANLNSQGVQLDIVTDRNFYTNVGLYLHVFFFFVLFSFIPSFTILFASPQFTF